MKIAIIGGGIVGSVTAFYLSQTDHQVTLYDSGIGQATKAAAGIICPWFSKRRNKPWYRMANAGAHFYPQLIADLAQAGITSQAYQKRTTWLLKKREKMIDELMAIANRRKENSPLIGQIRRLKPSQAQAALAPWTYDQDLIQIDSGAAVIDGELLCQELLSAAQDKGLSVIPEAVAIDAISSTEVKIQQQSYDRVIIAAGAWLGEILAPFTENVDIRPQKGQLLVYDHISQAEQWPLIMPEGQADIIPHQGQRLFLGATHENDQGFDLSPDLKALEEIMTTAQDLLPAIDFSDYQAIKVGTRAYTSDFAPFYGALPKYDHIYVASGLGSSGLTTGPIIGHELAAMVTGSDLQLDPSDYPVGDYINF
ncbi:MULTISPECIES: NAD(P)/FAD-dependent oxidoreductase [Aerococcus]|uniref:NAD(P)/FAD-dependent oxidoreductase n=1 Tax=Aerococcus TaxID=1375 RepID=UPI000DCE9355|nr:MULTISPECIES: FAD-dependent oxidoreductase [Aerococcus]KAA9234237.1 FAD-binding oxidoreductase [Aerococcus mictus]MDK6292442.1 FAD-dependent oxidoreductase [Aerococcus urinae]MDK6375143.1 FAD-dependent oxidoreductase [Aerococcus urinae]MDK6420614.1 FAD-dependent oxidoreductase [Aerococcus urinae]MDK8076004.1 FAD-dependent oxidoreductase [Aerococcus urinae]